MPALAYFGRGLANEDMGNIRDAYADYRRAAQLDPQWSAPRTAALQGSQGLRRAAPRTSRAIRGRTAA